MKICSKCKIEKDLEEFSKRKDTKDRLCYICKECSNKYNKKYRKENEEKTKTYGKKYRKENEEKTKTYHNSKANFDIYALQISYAEKVKNVDSFLQVRCAYCGRWYYPITLSVKNRIQSLNSNDGRESRLYCSDECKEACPIYRKRLYQEGHPKLNKNNQTREVQPELRQIVFERDNYTCLKCKKHQDELDVPLHCHHTEGIRWNPIESADIDQCMTVCKDCHKKIHKQEDCGYYDMRCKNSEVK